MKLGLLTLYNNNHDRHLPNPNRDLRLILNRNLQSAVNSKQNLLQNFSTCFKLILTKSKDEMIITKPKTTKENPSYQPYITLKTRKHDKLNDP